MKLDDIRKKIDLTDKKILTNLAERMQLAKDAKKLKIRANLPIEDKSREKEIINNRKNKGTKLGLSKSFVSKIFNLVIKESKRIQKKYERVS